MEDRIRVLRVIEYEGPRSWVEEQIRRSVHGELWPRTESGCVIRAATLGAVPTLLENGNEEDKEV